MKNKVVAVIGAYGGMGKAVSNKLYQEGYNLALIGRSSKKLEDLKNQFPIKDDKKVTTHTLDLSENDFIPTVIQDVYDKHNYIETVVNAAGRVVPGPILNLEINDWQDALQTNFLGMVQIVTLFAERMVKRKEGHIILINGVLALEPDPNMLINSTLTGAVNNFAKAISKDLGKNGVRINVLNPGATDTPLWDLLYKQFGLEGTKTKNEFLAQIAQGIPLNRLASPQDIANIISFLCSPRAKYLNGAFLTVDGGACATY